MYNHNQVHATTKVLEALGPNLDFDIPLIVNGRISMTCQPGFRKL